MGVEHSDNNCESVSHDSVCNCFRKDKHIKSVIIKRDLKVKWLWTIDHSNILFTILSENKYGYNAPTAIINLIKHFSYCMQEEYYITETRICKEYYYLKNKQLLKKKLCSQWYSCKLPIFPIAIYSTNINNT
eukprot:53091_1